MKKNLHNKVGGFTLIELLVVIAIIGILSSVVLVSLSTARNKGAGATVKADLSGIRSQAEIAYSNVGCYAASGTTCSGTVPAAVALVACPTTGSSVFVDTTVAAQIAGAIKANGSYAACSSTAGGTAWAVAALLPGGVAATADSGWCVDSTGKSKSINVATIDQAGIIAEVSSGACVE